MTVADDLDLVMSIPDSAFGEGLRSEARARVEDEIARLQQQTDMIDLYEFRARRAEAEIARIKIGIEHVICDSPGTPDSVKGYLRKLISEDESA